MRHKLQTLLIASLSASVNSGCLAPRVPERDPTATGGSMAQVSVKGEHVCVGMFFDPTIRGKVNIAADSTSITPVGSVPCREQVIAWALQGPFRVFADGTVEALATPIPPCPDGDYWIWIAYPK